MKHFQNAIPLQGLPLAAVLMSLAILPPRCFAQAETAPGQPLASAPNSSGREPLPWRDRIGIGVKMSSLGAGAEAALELTRRLNLRGGFNNFTYDRSFTNSGISFDGRLTLRSASANLDYYVLGPLHLSPGLLFYDGNRGAAPASVAGGQSFTLGGTTYVSNPANPAAGNATLTFNSVAPEFLIGLGNLVPRSHRHFTVNFEIGAAYQGSPAVKLNIGGTVCTPMGTGCVNAATDPTVQGNLLSQQNKLNRSLSFFRFYPVLSMGFGYRF